MPERRSVYARARRWLNRAFQESLRPLMQVPMGKSPATQNTSERNSQHDQHDTPSTLYLLISLLLAALANTTLHDQCMVSYLPVDTATAGESRWPWRGKTPAESSEHQQGGCSRRGRKCQQIPMGISTVSFRFDAPPSTQSSAICTNRFTRAPFLTLRDGCGLCPLVRLLLSYCPQPASSSHANLRPICEASIWTFLGVRPRPTFSMG